MRQTTMDKTQLAAFADGELPPEEAAAVVMHLADHPEDQAYVDDLMAANAALARAFAYPIHEPVPPAILATITGAPQDTGRVIPFARRGLAFGGLALAASVVLAAVMWPAAPQDGLPVGPIAQSSPLLDHLQALPSGQTVAFGEGRDLTVLATLPVQDGFCREVEVIDRNAARLDMALACTQGSGWQIAVALSEPLPDAALTDGYVPAGGAETAALTPWLDRMGAGLVLDPRTEADRIAQGWAR